MIVVDASVVLDLLLNRPPRATVIARRLAEDEANLLAPELLDVEVAQVLRRFLLRGELSPDRAAAALDDLASLPLRRYGHGPLLKRAFALRDHATAYGAVYLALAEISDATLLTADAALALVPGCRARVEVVGP